jgi:hypothetical protein
MIQYIIPIFHRNVWFPRDMINILQRDSIEHRMGRKKMNILHRPGGTTVTKIGVSKYQIIILPTHYASLMGCADPGYCRYFEGIVSEETDIGFGSHVRKDIRWGKNEYSSTFRSTDCCSN